MCRPRADTRVRPYDRVMKPGFREDQLMIHEVRHAWRTLVRMPVLSIVVVVSLGAGIGVNTAVFSWIQAVILRPLPGVRDAGGFYTVEPRAETGSYPGMSWLEYRDL